MSGTNPEKDAEFGTPPLNAADDMNHDAMDHGAPPLDGEPSASQAYVDPSIAMEIRIAELEDELEKAKDRHLRSLAEAENTRRRSQRDRDEAQKYGGVKLARDLLPVHDNLQRALKSVTDEQREAASDFFAGVELTERELVNAFGKHGILPIAPELGDKFDVNKHQAMFEAPVPGAADGSIIEVIQTGFICHDRLVRAAMVGVAKGGGGAAPDAANDYADTPDSSS